MTLISTFIFILFLYLYIKNFVILVDFHETVLFHYFFPLFSNESFFKCKSLKTILPVIQNSISIWYIAFRFCSLDSSWKFLSHVHTVWSKIWNWICVKSFRFASAFFRSKNSPMSSLSLKVPFAWQVMRPWDHWR